MPVTFEVDGDNTTITMSWTQPTAMIQEVFSLVAESQWQTETDEDGVVINPFSAATYQEKLDIAFTYAARCLLERAMALKINKASRAAAIAEAQDALEL
jgi:hypothetical protein